MRRFLWGHTEIAGDTLEYNGTALELLIGFLLALTLLLPLYAGFFFAAIELGLLGELSNLIALVSLVSLVWLGHFARYRARRYRLTRTIFRGVRFQQSGYAWRYAFRALGWWAAVVLTLGLAYPWAQANLERYKMSNSYYGDLPGWFNGSPLRLFLSGFPLWLALVGPFFGGLYLTLRSVNWNLLLQILAQGGDDMLARIEGSTPGITTALVAAIGAIGWALLGAVLLYPAFRTIVLRWWLSGLTFGDLTVRSRLHRAQVYSIYLRFLWSSIMFAVVAGLFGAAMLAAFGFVLEQGQASKLTETVAVALLVGGYVILALAYSTTYQVQVKFALWQAAWDSLELSGVRALDHVRSVGGPSSARGEGLADALHLGSI
jgi:uncharacterized membrane protein YjgN (DUF898 family)